MDKGTALTLLGLDGDASQEDVMERLDAETFAVRDHFMRQPIVPSLFRSRVNRLVQLSDVAQSLVIAPLGAPVDLPDLLPTGGNLLLLVRNHIENIRRLRTEMAATLDPDVLAHFGNAMTNLQLRYMEGFLSETAEWSEDDSWPDGIPAREESDWQKVLKAINDGPIQGMQSPTSDVVLNEWCPESCLNSAEITPFQERRWGPIERLFVQDSIHSLSL